MPARENKRKEHEKKHSKIALKPKDKASRKHTDEPVKKQIVKTEKKQRDKVEKKPVHKPAKKQAEPSVKKLSDPPAENRTAQQVPVPEPEAESKRSSHRSDKRSNRQSDPRVRERSERRSRDKSDRSRDKSDRSRRLTLNPTPNYNHNLTQNPALMPQYNPLENRATGRAGRRSTSQVEPPVSTPADNSQGTPVQQEQTPADIPNQVEAAQPPVETQAPTRKRAGRSKEVKIVPMDDWEIKFSEAVLLHHQGIAGDKAAAKQAQQLLERILLAVPDNNLVRAYCGSATSLLGRDVPSPKDKLKYGKKGLILLDEAVSADPGNLEIRTLRGIVCNKLPEKYFHRTRNAIEDFRFIVDHYVPGSSGVTQEMYWKILYDLGTACKQMDLYEEAKAAWEKLMSVTTDPKYKALLAEEGLTMPALASRSYVVDDVSEEEVIPAQAFKLHQLALKGDKRDAKKALDLFSKAMHEHPANQVIKAYYADCLSLQASHEDEASKMFAGVYEAQRLLDSAVNARPRNVKIRLLRAYNCIRLPEAFFHRTTTAIEDLEYLIRRYEEDPTVFSDETYEQLLYELGKAYQQLELEEESEEVFQTLLDVNPDSKYQTVIRSKTDTQPDYAAFYSSNKETLFKEGQRLHQLAVEGDKKATVLAHDLWKRAQQSFAGDPIAAAYYGSSIALLGRDASEPQQMFQSIFEGLKYVNQAVEAEPNNAQLRVIRAYFLYSLPEAFFHMTERAITDFEQVVSAYREKTDESITAETYHQVLYDLGMAYKRVGNGWKAPLVWQTLLNESSDPKYEELKERMYRI